MMRNLYTHFEHQKYTHSLNSHKMFIASFREHINVINTGLQYFTHITSNYQILAMLGKS